MRSRLAESNLDLALLIGFILIASLDSVFKYTGGSGLAAYAIGGSVLLFVYFRKAFPVLVERTPLAASALIAGMILVGLIAATFYLYHLANSGLIGPGSDGDDALIIGATELLNGRYPFYPPTYLGNPIAPMPGAILYALPFVALGIYPLQNMFWLVAFFGIVGFWTGSFRGALFLAIPILLVSPTIFQNLAAGSDHITNSVLVLLFTLLIIRAVKKNDAKLWEWLIPAILLGIGLSTRTNFAFVMPLLVVWIAKVKGVRRSLTISAVVATAFLIVTLPFYLYDPPGFTPLYVQSGKMQQFNDILPQAGLILGICSLLLSTILAFRASWEKTGTFFQSLAWVQLFILLFTSTLYILWVAHFNLYFGHIGYGLFVMFFGVFAQWARLAPTRSGMD
ncbi:MAG TPA: hypothetical protein VFZ49_10610 [Pyrinomonadaceae bacterium]